MARTFETYVWKPSPKAVPSIQTTKQNVPGMSNKRIEGSALILVTRTGFIHDYETQLQIQATNLFSVKFISLQIYLTWHGYLSLWLNCLLQNWINRFMYPLCATSISAFTNITKINNCLGNIPLVSDVSPSHSVQYCS